MPSTLTSTDPLRLWYQRLTIVGVVIVAVIKLYVTNTLINTGVLPTGTSGAVMDCLSLFGWLLIVLGYYKHISKPK